MTSYDPDPPASTADLPRQARLQALLGRTRALASDGSWGTVLKILQRLPEELEGIALAEKGDRERIGRLEAEVENLRKENELLRAMSQPDGIPKRLPPPPTPPPPRNETLQVEDIDIQEALDDAFTEDDPPELREITRDFIAGINRQIRRIRNEDK